MKSEEREIGRIIARLVAHEVSLPECAAIIQAQIDLIKLDAERSGYERGVREAAEKALPTNLDMAEHEDELCATYYERGRNDAYEAILSLRGMYWEDVK